MLPMTKMVRCLEVYKGSLNQEFDDLIAGCRLVAEKTNVLEMDEDGYYYVMAAGVLEEVIATLEVKLAKLKRIKTQKDSLR